MSGPDAWPFADPPNFATLTTDAILRGREWIARVSHDADDGAWQFLPSGGFEMEETMLVSLHHLFKKDPTIGDLADLPLGWRAWRGHAPESELAARSTL